MAHHVLDPSDSEAVMRFAGECVKEGEVDRTRAELVRQLGDLEAAEMKNNLKVSGTWERGYKKNICCTSPCSYSTSTSRRGTQS